MNQFTESNTKICTEISVLFQQLQDWINYAENQHSDTNALIYTYNIWGSTNMQVSPRVTLTIFWKKKQKMKFTRRRKHYTWQIVRLGKKTSHEPMVLLGQNEWTSPISIGGGKIRVSENVFFVCLAMAFPEVCTALQMPIPAVVQNNDRAPFR